MARPQCSICNHPLVVAINAALVAPGATLSQVSEKYQLPVATLGRHRKNHLGDEVSRALARLDRSQDGLVREQLESTERLTLEAIEKAQAAGDHKAVASLILTRHKTIEMVARLVNARGFGSEPSDSRPMRIDQAIIVPSLRDLQGQIEPAHPSCRIVAPQGASDLTSDHCHESD